MVDLRTLIRPLLATPFIVGGINALRAPEAMAAKSEDIAVRVAEAVGLAADPVMLVKLNAGTQIGGGILLALGVAPRLASLVLSSSLVPTTIAGHRFWEHKEPGDRSAQLIQFAKNAGLLGGLLAAALDTGGRPSVFWTSRRAVGRAAHSIADSANTAYQVLPGVS